MTRRKNEQETTLDGNTYLAPNAVICGDVIIFLTPGRPAKECDLPGARI
jgi:hypothetical protein